MPSQPEIPTGHTICNDDHLYYIVFVKIMKCKFSFRLIEVECFVLLAFLPITTCNVFALVRWKTDLHSLR